MESNKKLSSTSIKCNEAIQSSLRFARIHILMISLLLLFFGILIVPLSIKQIKLSQYKEIQCKIKKVSYANRDIPLSILNLEYEFQGKTYDLNKEIFYQKIEKNNQVIVYVNTKKPTDVIYRRPNMWTWIILFIVYIILLISCFLFAWRVYFTERSS